MVEHLPKRKCVASQDQFYSHNSNFNQLPPWHTTSRNSLILPPPQTKMRTTNAEAGFVQLRSSNLLFVLYFFFPSESSEGFRFRPQSGPLAFWDSKDLHRSPGSAVWPDLSPPGRQTLPPVRAENWWRRFNSFSLKPFFMHYSDISVAECAVRSSVVQSVKSPGLGWHSPWHCDRWAAPTGSCTLSAPPRAGSNCRAPSCRVCWSHRVRSHMESWKLVKKNKT